MRQNLNIPIEIVRTVVAVSECGSLTKAADRLGLSQPAVSAQMKRIEGLVGGNIFTKTANGTAPTQLGRIVLHHARKILEANDQMLRIVGVADTPDFVRLGLSTLFMRPFFARQTAQSLARVHLHMDHSTVIAKGLIDGFIDIACIFENPASDREIESFLVDSFEDRLVWVRARDFVLSPGRPIPVLSWPGDEWMVRALTARGLSFRIVMHSPDYHAKEAAVEAGIGLTAIPSRLVPPSLVVASEYYLPELPAFKALLYQRPGVDTEAATTLRVSLTSLFFDKPAGQGDFADARGTLPRTA